MTTASTQVVIAPHVLCATAEPPHAFCSSRRRAMNALNDARDHLESCVASLRDDPGTTPSTIAATKSSHTHTHHNPMQDVIDSPVLRAYERLRRELGLAFANANVGGVRCLSFSARRPQPRSKMTMTKKTGYLCSAWMQRVQRGDARKVAFALFPVATTAIVRAGEPAAGMLWGRGPSGSR